MKKKRKIDETFKCNKCGCKKFKIVHGKDYYSPMIKACYDCHDNFLIEILTRVYNSMQKESDDE